MKQRCLSLSLLALPLAFLTACGAGDGSLDSASVSEASESASEIDGSQTRVLAEIDAGYGTITFLESTNADGSVVTAIGEEVPLEYGSTPLTNAVAGHTTLEVFLAVAPGAEVPESLVNAHAQEAAQLGRATDEVVAAEFDANGPVEKSIATCDTFAWGDAYSNNCGSRTYSNKTRVERENGGNGVAHVKNSTYFTKKSAMLAACNESTTTSLKAKVSWDNSNGSGNLGTKTVAKSSKYRVYSINMSYNGSCTPPPGGLICIPPQVGTHYRINSTAATGVKHRLRAAEVVDLPCIK